MNIAFKESLIRHRDLLETPGVFFAGKQLRAMQKKFGRIVRRLEAAARSDRPLSESEVWTLDNAVFLCDVMSGAAKDAVCLSLGQYRLFCAFLREISAPIAAEDLEGFFAFMKSASASHRAFRDLKLCLITALATVLCERAERGGEVASLIRSLRTVSSVSEEGLISAYSPLEEILRRDPAHAYGRMEYAYRARVCEAMEKRARRARRDVLEYARERLCAAQKTGAYIGEGLEEKTGRAGFVYGAATLIFGTLLGLFFASFFTDQYSMGAAALIGFLLAGQGASSAVIALFDALFSKFVRQKPLFRLKFDRLPKEACTMVVYTALCSSVEDISEIAARLESAYYASFVPSRGEENLKFALLLDLPEAKTESVAEDEPLLEHARRTIAELRDQYGNFYLFCRKRTRGKEGRYLGRERKRGALLSLVSLLSGEESELSCPVGDVREVLGTKYVLTLDSDTVITPGCVQEMVGILEHPLNRAVVEEVRGVPVVRRGYAVLQPLIVPSAESASKTPFAVLQTGGGGMSAYAQAAFDRAQTLFGHGLFCGKGMFSVPVFHRVLKDAFPDNAILSHDLLEGARLSCAAVTDLVLIDEVPATPRAHSEREHRWCRGDVQALFFSGFRSFDRFGVRRANPIGSFYRAALWDNLRRALVPVFSAVLLLFSPFVGAGIDSVLISAALFPYVIPAAVDVFYLLFTTRLRSLYSRFVSPVSGGIWQRVLSLFYALSSLFWETYSHADAILRALWRMCVSGRGRLEWKTASAARRGRESLLSYGLDRFGAVVAGAFLLTFSDSSVARLIGALSVLHPLFSYLLARPYPTRSRTLHLFSDLERYAARACDFFLNEVGDHTRHLPPDHVTFAPVSVRAMRTSPTNIGLYLVSLCAAVDLGKLGVTEALLRLEKCLSTIERLPTWRGLLYNWYDIEHLSVLGQGYVSSVDCGNYLACLTALDGFLLECEQRGETCEAIRARVRRLIDAGNLKSLYQSGPALFSIGCDTESGRMDDSHYDLYMSEARLTSFFAVARGQVPLIHWARLGRPLLSRGGYLGAASYSGTAFEYFMPSLFLPIAHASFEEEALHYAARAQRRHGVRTGEGVVFGVSESAYFASDALGDYPYRANGISELALRRTSVGEGVISPYSSFLMLPVLGDRALENLRRLERLGFFGKYGFFEAGEAAGGKFDVVQSVYAHHTGMSLIAAVNALYDNVFCRRFFQNPEMRAARELISERIPADARILPLRPASSERPAAAREGRVRRIPQGAESADGVVIPSFSASLIYGGEGEVNVLWRRDGGILLARPHASSAEGGFVARALLDGVLYSSRLSENPKGVSAHLRRIPGGIQLSLTHGLRRVLFSFFLSARENALAVETEIVGEVREARVSLSFDALLRDEKSYYAHPAFSTVSLSSHASPSAFGIVCRKRGEGVFALSIRDDSDSAEGLLHVLAGDDLTDAGSAREAFVRQARQSRPAGDMASCGVLCWRAISASRLRTHHTHRFLVGYGEGAHASATAASRFSETLREESLRRTQDALAAGFYTRAVQTAKLSDVFAKLCRSVTFAVLHARCIRLLPSSSEVFSREELYRYGLSGDLPIVLCPVGEGEEGELYRTLASLHRYHAICGFSYDLVFFAPSDGYLRRGAQAASAAVSHAGSDYLWSRRGGVFVIEGDRRVRELLETAACVSVKTMKSVFEHRVPAPLSVEVGGVPQDFFEEGQTPCRGSGRFLREGFLIEKDRLDPKENFAHLIASSTFGALVTHRSLGFTFETSSRFRRLTRADNDARLRSFGERLVLKTSEGVRYDLAAASSKVLFSPGWAQYFGCVSGIQYRLTVFCHPTLLFRCVRAELYGQGNPELSYEIEPVLGDENGVLGAFFTTPEEGALVITRALRLTERPLKAYLALRGETPCRCGEGIGLSASVSLNGEAKELVFFLGAKETDEQFERVREYQEKMDFDRLFSEATGEIRATLAPPIVEGGEGDLRSFSRAQFLNVWLPYQALTSRMKARCGFYQPGGAFGFRDQLQDALMYLEYAPEKCAVQILRHAAHQFVEGDVLHWWHNLPDASGRHRGVRTHISDDYLWLIYACAQYVKKTGDLSFLEREVPFLVGERLPKEARDRYDAYAFGEKASLLCHLIAAADLFLERGTGERGLALMLGGDWNDGFDAWGEGAESVFLSEFGALCLRRLARILRRMGVEEARARRYEEASRAHLAAVRASFAHGRFARGYLGDQTVVGQDPTLQSACSIDVLPQVFAAFCYLDLPAEERTEAFLSQVLEALSLSYHTLFDREHGVFRLFTPPFDLRARNIGYIRSYASGVRENGGQYSHAAVWFAFAARGIARESKEESLWRARAQEVLEAVLPYRAAFEEEAARRYRLEPYALCGDVRSSPHSSGRGGWSHYTGSAAWAWRYFATEGEEECPV